MSCVRARRSRIVDLEGNQAVDTLFFNADDPAERYSAIRHHSRAGQHLSDVGHEAHVGPRPADADHRRRHLRPPRHARRRLLGREQHGALRLGKEVDARLPRQLSARGRRARSHRALQARHRPQHQFLHERAGDAATASWTFADGISAPGKYVEMRAEMDVLVLISNCPQLNNPCNAYNPTPMRRSLILGRGRRAADRCSARSSSPIAAPSPAASSARCAAWASPRSPSIRTPTAIRCTCAGRRGRCDRAGAGRARAICKVDAHSRAAAQTGAEAIHPGYGFLSRERRLRRGLRARRASPSSVRRPSRCAPSASSTRRASWRAEPACRCCRAAGLLPIVGARRSEARTHRLSGDAQEHRRRRRHRHALLPQRGRTRAAVRACRTAGARQLQGRRRLPREIRRARAPHRGADLRRRPGQCRRARRARLLGAAAQPEGHRGDAGARASRCRLRAALCETAVPAGPGGAATARAGTVEFVYDTATRANSISSRSTPGCRSSTA